MKRAILLCCFLFFNNLQGECATTLFPPLKPMLANPIQECGNTITSLADPFAGTSAKMPQPDIGEIEKSLFGRTYANQNITSRLSRIEKTLFSTTYPNANQTQRIDNIISNFNQMNKYPNISKNSLSKMEMQVFNECFALNNAQRRIERLEEEVFGAVQSGDFDSRYEALKMATKSLKKNTNILSNNDPFNSSGFSNMAPKSGWKGIASSMSGGMLGGSMTGFTPPISPFYNNYSGYNNSNNNLYPYRSGYNTQRGYRTNNGGYGYREDFTDYGCGTGVTILD